MTDVNVVGRGTTTGVEEERFAIFVAVEDLFEITVGEIKPSS